jgi:hypothetical protein
MVIRHSQLTRSCLPQTSDRERPDDPYNRIGITT